MTPEEQRHLELREEWEKKAAARREREAYGPWDAETRERLKRHSYGPHATRDEIRQAAERAKRTGEVIPFPRNDD
jgi:rubrerythrin